MLLQAVVLQGLLSGTMQGSTCQQSHGIVCVFVCSLGSTEVDAELQFNPASGISAKAVAETLTLAASDPEFPLPLNVSSIVVSGM